MVAGRRCAAVRATAERVLLRSKVPTRYTANGISVATAARIVGEAFDADHRQPRPRVVGAA